MASNPETAVAVVAGDFQPREVIRINDYPRDRFNLLIPGAFALQVTPFLRPVAREYSLDPDPEHGEVYVQEWTRRDGQFMPKAMGISAVGLGNLANVAGILDVPQASGRVDDGREPGVVTYRSTMFMRLPDGAPMVKTREATLELAVLLDEVRDRIEKKGRENKYNGKPEPWSKEKVEAEIRKESITTRRFFHRKCETAAKTRTERALLGIRGKYTPAEIARPFVLAAVVPDVNQPEVRERMLDQATSSAAMLFGGGGTVGAAPRQLAAGPSPEAIAAAQAEAPPAERLTAEELAELGGAAEPTGDDQDDADDGAATEQPDWLQDAAAGDSSTATASTATPSTLATTIRDQAGESKLKGKVTAPQLARLPAIFEGIGGADVRAGILGLFGHEGNREQLTSSQANALIVARDSFESQDAWVAAWAEIVEQSASAAA